MTTTASTAQRPSAQTTAARAQAAHPRKPGADAHGPETGADLFAAMLSLLSAAPDIPPDTEPDDTAPQTLSATDRPGDPLQSWPGAPGTGAPTSGASAAALNGTALTPGTPALAAEAPGAGPTGVDLQGMQRLEQPAAPDEQTLAALARGDGDARTTPPHPATSESTVAPPATRPTAWRSTVTGATTTSVQQQHASQTLSHSLSERLQVRLETFNPVALRSTVTLDDRFNQAAVGDSPALPAGLVPHGQASAPGAGGFAGDQPGAGGDTAQDPRTALSGDSETPSDSPRFDEALTDQDADEHLGAWSSPTLRQASLRVGDGGEEAIDIQLSMNGQELNVAFRTDNADARAELRENAGESLADLLQRSGIQLGDVSVGSQGQSPGRGEPGEPRHPPATTPRNGTTTVSAAPAPAAVAPRPRSDGSRPLDLFV